MRSFAGRDILSLKGFEREEFYRVFEVADRLAPIARDRRNSDLLAEKILVTAFYQPSTRTRLAHEAAMLRLGGRGTGFADPKMTRAGGFYQGAIKDTGHMLGGDMRMRTMHSISYAMSQFDIQASYIAPQDMSLTPEFKQELDELSVRYQEVEHIEQVVDQADVIYMEPVVQPDYTKPRDERGGQVGMTPANYQVTKALMRKAKPDCIILRSPPRMDELLEEVDYTRHARYWAEAFNGVVMRMALLSLVLGKME